MKAQSRESGQASPLIIGALLLSLAFAGLGIDGARMFTARRDLQNQADAAALAAASALDEGAYRASSGMVVKLDPDRARIVIARLLGASALPRGTDVAVDVNAERAVVRLRRPVPTTLLRIIGVNAKEIGASATAAPRTG
ncbi:MAG: hypothetical protein EXQ69_00765 [Acidimicrobiia bacterium]|nr:hypothetical protein [Acidimicrobiia bacterium]